MFGTRCTQQVPGFQVGEVLVARTAGIELNAVIRATLGKRHDVPDVLRDDEECHEVDLVRLIHLVTSAAVTLIMATKVIHGGLHLDTKESSAVLDGEVVAGGVSPGLADGEAVVGGAGHELQLDPFAAALGVLDHTFGVASQESGVSEGHELVLTPDY